MKGPDDLAVGPAVGHVGLVVGPERETLAAALQHAEVVVVGVVLHHQHDDVLDLRQEVRPRRQGGPRARSLLPGRAPPGPAPHLMAFELLPHVGATLGRIVRGMLREPHV